LLASSGKPARGLLVHGRDADRGARVVADIEASGGAANFLAADLSAYLGEIVHKGQSHRGEHPPIIDQPLWEAVQAQLAGHTTQHNPGTRTRQPSLLAGMLFDRDGNRMTPTHAVKKGARYHYYVSRPLITKDQTERSAGLRIPAADVELLVTSRVRQWLLDPSSIYKVTRLRDPSAQRRPAICDLA